MSVFSMTRQDPSWLEFGDNCHGDGGVGDREGKEQCRNGHLKHRLTSQSVDKINHSVKYKIIQCKN